jgi:hypothetical protein
MINLLFIGDRTLLQTPTHDAKNEYIKHSISLYFLMAYNHYLSFNGDFDFDLDLDWCVSLSNIYTILVTNFTKLIEQNKIKLWATDKQYVENFAIIFPSEFNNSTDQQICNVERTLEADLSKTVCQNFNANQKTVVEIISEKWIYSQY